MHRPLGGDCAGSLPRDLFCKNTHSVLTGSCQVLPQRNCFSVRLTLLPLGNPHDREAGTTNSTKHRLHFHCRNQELSLRAAISFYQENR